MLFSEIYAACSCQVEMSLLEECISIGDKTSKGAIGLVEFVQMLTMDGVDNSLGIFGSADADFLKSACMEVRSELQDRSESYSKAKLPVGLQLQLNAVGSYIPVEKFKAVCSLNPKKRTDSELNELSEWLTQSAHMELLDGLSPPQMQELMRHATVKAFAAGQTIFDPALEANQVYLILDGHAMLDLPIEEQSSGLFMPWAWLRNEAKQAHSCVATLVAFADLLRPGYALTGECVRALMMMGSACSTAANHFDRWIISFSNQCSDDCSSILNGQSVTPSTIQTAVDWIEQAWPSIEAAGCTLQLMFACEGLLQRVDRERGRTHEPMFVDIAHATQALLTTAKTLFISLNRLKNAKAVLDQGGPATLQSWESVPHTYDLEAEQVP